MIVAAYLLSLAIGADSKADSPELLRSFTSADACLIVAHKLNYGTVNNEGSIQSGKFHFCVRVMFPA